MPLDHVALTVADRERSAAFYAEHFALAHRVHEDHHLLILADDAGSLLALSQGEPAAAGLPRTNHFGFRLASAAEVNAARARFRDAGVQETESQAEPQGGAPARVQVLDPDGYRVEVYAY
jgi:catechol 2,3-dioxygenase-like lactoylglutathione lyase family enzyme